MKKVISAFIIISIASISSCDNFLNVVPDKTGTIDNAFRQKSKAEKYLYSIYSYLPKTVLDRPGFMGGDEIWVPPVNNYGAIRIARGQQKIDHPRRAKWSHYYKGIRKANIFMKKIHNVGNMTDFKKKKWAAEAKFLKAYYYFELIRMYGPVILFKNNVSPNASVSEIKVSRSPVDSCFSYVIKLLNEVIDSPQLPDKVLSPQENLGRINKSIAKTVKAQVWAYWASPLFNGNKAYENFTDINDNQFFDMESHPERWDSAATAAMDAIKTLKASGFDLYNFNNSKQRNDTTSQKMTIRNSITLGLNKSRPNVIWPITDLGSDHGTDYVQSRAMAFGVSRSNPTNEGAFNTLAPPLKIVEMFYTDKGLPIDQDTSWAYDERYDTKLVGSSERFNLRQGYKTAKLNMHREPRFYADLGFDGGIWYGAGVVDDNPASNLLYLRNKKGQIGATRTHGGNNYCVTGYLAKKLVNYKTVTKTSFGLNYTHYAWPQLRLAQLYLLYAEIKNEADGPSAKVYRYLNLVRKHAGIPKVQTSWQEWSKKPNYWQDKDNLRKIIHHEMLIESAFEGKRFWLLRRWKEAKKKLNEKIAGWDINQSSVQGFYRKRVIFNQQFIQKDYFWPLGESQLNRNQKLTQNPGWGN